MRKFYSHKYLALIFCVVLFTLSSTLRGGNSTTILTFDEHIISTDYNGALHACTIDIDFDGDIDIIDALLVAQYYVGLIDQFPN